MCASPLFLYHEMIIHALFDCFTGVNTTRASKDSGSTYFFILCGPGTYTPHIQSKQRINIHNSHWVNLRLNFNSLFVIWLFFQQHSGIPVAALKEDISSSCQYKPLTPTRKTKRSVKAQSVGHKKRCTLTYWHLDIMKTFNWLLNQRQRAKSICVLTCVAVDNRSVTVCLKGSGCIELPHGAAHWY